MPRRRANAAAVRQDRSRGSKRKKSSAPLTPSIARWNTVDDIELDNEDSFRANRDRILLEGEEDTDADDDGEEEVFTFGTRRGAPSDEDSEDIGHDEYRPKNGSTSKVKSAPRASKSVTGIPPASTSSDTDDDDAWGKKKSVYYSTNNRELESDDEEANDLHVQEAVRLQGKARNQLKRADFGLEDFDLMSNDWFQPRSVLDDDGSLQQPQKATVRSLQKTRPELLALIQDWKIATEELKEVEDRIKRYEADGSQDVQLGLLHLYYPENAKILDTMLSYVTTLAFYLHTAASDKTRHLPILDRLLFLREATLELRDIGAYGSSSSNSEDESDDWSFDDDVSKDFEAAISTSEQVGAEIRWTSPSNLKKAKVSSPDSSTGRTTSRSKKGPSNQPSVSYDLEEPVFHSTKSQLRPERLVGAGFNSHFGDPASLQAHDAQDKHSKKKTLRFHTSRIDSTHRRRADTRVGQGGDDDLPYPERRKAQRRAPHESGEDLDDSSEVTHPPTGHKRSRHVMEMQDSDPSEEGDGYYSLVKKQKQLAKEKQKAAHDDIKLLERSRNEGEIHDNVGPRSLTRAIMANKGLTTHRSKSVRNPRVKKRLRYEKAQRVVSSQKPTYRGGPKDGKYAGEMSGISSRTVKSVKY